VGIRDRDALLRMMDGLPDKEYKNMADVEKSVGKVL
jgi:hypothetical protein